LCIQVRQRLLQHLPMAWITRDLELLQDPLPGKLNGSSAFLLSDLLSSQRRSLTILARSRFFLLLLDRFAFPSSGHSYTRV